jgi:hypothetical protein
MSTNSTVVGMIFSGFAIAASAARRGSGTGTTPTIRVDGAERVVLGRDAGTRQRIEQRGLADVRQADDSRSGCPAMAATVRPPAAAVCSRFMIFSAPSVSRRGKLRDGELDRSRASGARPTALARSST